MTEEMLEKAKAAKSVEELLALARENNVELTEEQAKKAFDQLRGSGELADDDLENVAGGVADDEFLKIKLSIEDPNYVPDPNQKCWAGRSGYADHSGSGGRWTADQAGCLIRCP